MAAGIEPEVNMNPILLIPKSDKGSTVVIKGQEKGEKEAIEYYKYRSSLKPMILDTYNEIKSQSDIVVIEGAGSSAEINLKENDIVNMGMAEMAGAPVLLIADIDRGVFASLYGTVMLLEPHERARIKGLIVNKFRGDKSILEPGIKKIEDILNIPVIGVIPYVHLELVDEDSLIDYEKKCNIEPQTPEEINKELDKLSELLRKHLDIDYIYDIIKKTTE
ncbi:Cobyric acid synthase [Clostridium sp. N3C]|uniref:AAA family ATPase n=1 Tax=Clostridium sp. N3C TaxID=1776758 RepID=UPI00092E00FC|nr:AAA family ATPase [Clostridium sp. N3C]SCN26217.1 Cobyric acid synthase [Clostridium sp. N3C]